jgi:aminopeptidase N
VICTIRGKLHTLRQIVNDDEKWRTILRGLNSFYHQTVTTKQIEDYLSSAVGIDLEPFQYLRDSTYIRILLQRQYS